MGVQFIFVVETNRGCKSDWIYIKETINHFYNYDNNVKLSEVYMDGKGRYQYKESKRCIIHILMHLQIFEIIHLQ